MSDLQNKPQEWTRSIPDSTGGESNFVVSTDRALLSVPAVMAAFREDYIYWAGAVSEESTQKMLENSLCFGLYRLIPATRSNEPREMEQIGLSRLITDYVTFVYLCDVYILPEYQGTGLGTWMMGIIQDELNKMQNLRRIILMTRGERTKNYYEKLLGVEKMGTAGQTYIMGRIGPSSRV